MSQEPKQYKVLISTDPGKVRALNEDNFVLNKTVRRAESPFQHVRARSLREPLLCGVFDGMGGEKGGREASEIAARIAVEYYLFLSKSRVDPSGSIGDFVSNCNSQIKGYLTKHRLNRGGSTFAMAYFHDGAVNLFSMGDSRIYLFRRGSLMRISRDHTLAQKKFEARLFTLEESETSPERHMLTRFLGMDEDSDEFCAEAYRTLVMEPGDKLLICSDGLYDMCTEREIADILAVPDQPYTIQLINRALANGGEDNVTCMVIELV